MIDLAIQDSHGRPVQAARIAERHGIPLQFLLQILRDLKRAKLVTSTRGASGGYRLDRPPEELSLASVVDVFEADDEPTDCAAADSPLAPSLLEVCRDLAQARRKRLASVSLAEIAERAAVNGESMWYI